MHHHDMTNTISKPTLTDFALMGITAFIWASAFIAIKVVVVETGPLWLAAWRVGIGFVVLLPYALWRGLTLPKSKKVWGLIFITALFNVVLPFFFISWAETKIDAGVTSLLMGAGPLLALLGSHLFTSDDKITFSKGIAVAFGFAGVLTIVGVDAINGLGGSTMLAQIAAITGTLCYTIAGLLVRRINIPPITLASLAFGAGLIQLLIASFVFEGSPKLELTPTVIGALIYLGIVPTAVGQIIRFTLIKKIGYATFSLALNLIPVLGLSMGALLLGEVITLRTFIALALVLTGLLISQLKR